MSDMGNYKKKQTNKTYNKNKNVQKKWCDAQFHKPLKTFIQFQFLVSEQ
jgi:hypothetical protein